MSELWQQAKELFFQISELPESEHEHFIATHTANNPKLKALLLELISGDTNDSEPLAASQLVSKQARELLQESYMAKQGERFANYQIIDTLGEGGMGIVYLANRVDAQFKQTVAIKVIHSKNLITETIERFRQERKILASLQDPNIAQLIDGGETAAGLPYIVMEYVNGTNIIDYCKANKLNVNQRLNLFHQVLSAVDYAHQRLIIHRDLKPSNVLVTQEGNVKLLDFGIAKLLDANNVVEEPHLTKIDIKILTPLNASPEQVRSEQATTRTDIYGLCTLLYQMLTEKPLFETQNLTSVEIESWILDKMPTKPSSNISESHSAKDLKLASTLSGDLDTIILKGLQKEPQRRYSSVEQLSADIHRFQNCFPIKAKPDSKWYVTKKFIQRNRTASILSSVFLLLVIGFISALVYQTQQTTQQRDIALRESSNSRVISEFLKQTFNAASPYVSGDKQVSPKDLIDNAKNRLTSYEIEPVLRGQLQTTLADVYLALSEFDQAKSLIDQADNNYKQADIVPDILLIELEEIKIKHAYFIGGLEDAFDRLSPVLDKLEGMLANTQNQDEYIRLQNKYIDLLLTKAGTLADMGDEQEGLEFAQKAMQLAEQLGDKRSSPRGEIYALLGHLYRRLYKFEESERVLLLAAEEARELYGDFNLELAYAYNQLASTYSKMDRLEEGVNFAKKGYEIRHHLYPDGHAEVGASLGMLSNLYRQLDDYDNAIKYRLLLTSMLDKLYGLEHYYVAMNAFSLADLYIENQDYEKGMPYIDLGERVASSQLPKGHFIQARGPYLRGKIFYDQNDFNNAVIKLEESMALLNENGSKGQSIVGDINAYLALSYKAKKQNDLAYSSKEKALAICKELYSAESKRYKKMQNLLEEI